MTAHFASIMQLGYVVDDVDAAIEHWAHKLGVGPFFVTERVPYAQVTFRGAPCDAQTKVALASHRGMQIELIEQVAGGPSIFTEFLARRGPGLHHVCALTDDLQTDLEAWSARGVEVLQGGSTTTGIGFAYLDTDPDDAGRVLELVHASAGLRRFFDRIEAAADQWDGRVTRHEL